MTGNQHSSLDEQTVEHLLKEEKAFFGRLFQSAAAPMFVIDTNHTILYWNNALAKLTGKSSFQMRGTKRHWEAFYPKKRPTLADLVIDRDLDSIDRYYACFNASQFVDNTYRAEAWFDNMGGKRRYLSFEATPVMNSNNIMVAAIETVIDLTDLKSAEEEIALSRAELVTKNLELGKVFSIAETAKLEWEKTIDCLRDFLILTDDNHRVRRCNRLLCDMTGKKFREVIGEDWRELLKEAGFVFTSFSGSKGELSHPSSNRMYDLNLYPIIAEQSEHIQSYVISLNDTTEIRSMTAALSHASAELHQAQQMAFQQEKLASIGQLAAGVAHEINNPMGFISSNLGTMEKYLARFREYIASQESLLTTHAPSTELSALAELRKKLKIDMILDDSGALIAESMDGASRIRRIVQDMKGFARSDQGEITMTDLNACLESTLNIAWNEIKYVADLHRDFGNLPPIKCHPNQINQVFLNLLVNAAQAMETKGRITVKTWSEGLYVFVSVIDTGKGIAPEILNRIFEPFYTTKEVGKGTGLGLSISYDIVNKHGGTIFVDSILGEGTTFTVKLPINGQPPAPEEN